MTGWAFVKLGDLTTVVTKGTTPTSIRYEFKDAGINFVKVESISNNGTFIPDKFAKIDDECNAQLKRSQLEENDILFSIAGAIGRTAIVPKSILPANTNQALAIIRLKPDAPIYPDYLLRALASQSIIEQTDLMKGGVAQQNLSLAQLKAFEIPLPPLPVQKAIVAKLDAAFASIEQAIAAAQQNAENAKQLFQSYLSDIFEKLKKHSQPKSLCDLTERITKGSSPKWQGISYTTEPGILFVTSENIGVNSLLLDKRKFVEEAFNQKDKKSILKKGDVLTNIVGASIGRTAVFELDDVANINQAVCLIRCKPDLLNSYYLSYLLNSPEYVYILHDNEVDNARANLSLGFFSKLEIQLPSKPLQEQTVALIRKAEQEFQLLSSIYEDKSNQLAALKQSLWGSLTKLWEHMWRSLTEKETTLVLFRENFRRSRL